MTEGEAADPIESPAVNLPPEILTEPNKHDPFAPDSVDPYHFPPPLEQPPLSPDSIMGPHSFIRLPNVLRRGEIANKKTETAEAEFHANMGRIVRLKQLDSDVRNSRFNQFALPPQRFPNAEEINKAYASSSTENKERLRRGIRKFTEEAINGTFFRLSDDVKALYLDQGETAATAKIDEIVNPRDNKKKKPFGQLGKDDQLNVLENLNGVRGKLLRENMGNYLGYLTAFQEAASLTDEKISKIRRAFEGAEPEKKTAMAAKIRLEAFKAMDDTKRANLARLRELEVQQGKPASQVDKEIEDLRASYRMGSFQQKEKVIDRINERKATAALPYLGDLISLRKALDHDDIEEIPTGADVPEISEAEQVSIEAKRINDLLVARMRNKSYSLAENYMDVIEGEVQSIARLYENPSFVTAFHVASLLRTGAKDTFYL